MLFSPLARVNSICRRTVSTLYSPEFVLHQENKERTITKYVKMQPIKRHSNLPARKAAVLVPICVVNGRVALLYTLRTSNLKNHRGQVSFPGGMKDDSDKNLIETALRETKEELGLDPKSIDVWCTGHQIVAKGKTTVTPVVGCIKKPFDLKCLKINRDEVEEAFCVELESLCNIENLGHTQFKGGYCMPVFTGGKLRVWGLTGVITYMFLKCLLPPHAYSHPLHQIPAIKSNDSTKYT